MEKNPQSWVASQFEVLASWVELIAKSEQVRVYSEWEDDKMSAELLKFQDDPAQFLLVLQELQFRPEIPSAFKAAAIEYFMGRYLDVLETESTPDIETSVSEKEPSDWSFPNIDIYEWRKKSLAIAKHKWRDVGLLGLSGYVVGKTKGLNTNARREILNWVFLRDDLRDIHDEEFVADWGGPLSSERLRKMANSLASFANGKAKSDKDYSVAIADWQKDLEYLRVTFYEGWQYDWPWPSIKC